MQNLPRMNADNADRNWEKISSLINTDTTDVKKA
jgi:hypothetical protein